MFRQLDDLPAQAKVLSALANVWDKRGVKEHAIALQRQALAIRNRLPSPSDRATSHTNLSNYLRRAGMLEESARHRLASFAYCIVCNLMGDLASSVCNLSTSFRRTREAGHRYEMPRLSELLALPEFEALARFLSDLKVDTASLQEAIDQRVEEARKMAESDAAADPEK